MRFNTQFQSMLAARDAKKGAPTKRSFVGVFESMRTDYGRFGSDPSFGVVLWASLMVKPNSAVKSRWTWSD